MNVIRANLILNNRYLGQQCLLGQLGTISNRPLRLNYSTAKQLNDEAHLFLPQKSAAPVNKPQKQFRQQLNLILDDLQTHYLFQNGNVRSYYTLHNKHQNNQILLNRYDSTSTQNDKPQMSRKEQLKIAFRDYGSTVIVFHVTVALISLGTIYLLVSSGLDVQKILAPLGLEGKVAANAGTFVAAYAIHKVFAPVRISITLAATPFIVRYLRRIGFLKMPKPKA